ncbi:FN3 associated domain-containing protein [Epilithonimonas sp.]|uniref:FN3 associated domain-containing protein n=1 Tax=Epilithonimonas sp. TaxID=2894511 RepID=UPI0028A2B02A|nr:chitobiase/beta-hexosaminidase C-terminal domain-containing protein [Epilithonimonas sp.]
MKKLLLFSFLIVFQSFFCQIEFGPYNYTNYSPQPYDATITGSGTIYYTTDGTDPSTSSPSGINQVNVPINQNIILKARLGNGQIFSRKYFVGEIPTKVMYFKPPASWNRTCSYMNYVQPETMVDFFGPGNLMTAVCEGWYKSAFAFYEAYVSFNNCNIVSSPIYQSVNVLTEDTIFYDYSIGPISNPPTCLLAVTDPSKK